MTSNISIRKARKTDLETLLKFEQEIVEYERPMEKNMMVEPFHYYDLSELLQLESAQVLVAEDKDKLVGSGFIHIRKARHYLDHEYHGYLGFMYVDPDYRGQGINQLIIEQLIQWAKDSYIDVLCLTVFSENQSAIKAYEKSGFYQNLIEMRLNLNE